MQLEESQENIQKLFETAPAAIILCLADITNQKKTEEVLMKYATYDELTGLLNRRAG